MLKIDGSTASKTNIDLFSRNKCILLILQGFSHETINNRKFIWMLSSTPELSKFVYVIKDSRRFAVIQEILDTWKTKVEPVIPLLEKGIFIIFSFSHF